jgi:arylsulfatase A-like enzyme
MQMAQPKSSKRAKHAICLVVDRLSAGFLGAYGNTWVRTPAFDRLAAESFLFDQAIIDSPRFDQLYRAFWRGTHAASTSRDEPSPNLIARLAAAGVATVLLTDEPEIRDLDAARDFEKSIEIEVNDVDTPYEAIEYTHLADFFAAAIESLADMDGPSLTWLHTRGMSAPWDAPLDFRNAYADEDDPTPPAGAKVPSRRLPADFDPDELLGLVHCYAGQVTLWDTCLGALLDAIDDSPARDEALLVVLSARGFPLGEHLHVGPGDDALYGELIHIPWLIRFPDGQAASLRTPSLVQPCDLFPTLLGWWGCDVPTADAVGRANLIDLARNPDAAVRNRAAVIGSDDEWAIRTPAWHLRHPKSGRAELFRKPDDRWEVNNVAGLCPDVVEKLSRVFDESRQGVWDSPLEDILAMGLD